MTAWLFDGGLVWFGAAVLALVAGGMLLHYRRSANRAGRSGHHFAKQVRTRTVKEDEDPRAIRAKHAERNPAN